MISVDLAAAGAGAPSRSIARPRGCTHCGSPIGDDDHGDFCCAGCETVHALLIDGGLTHFYALRSGGATPVPDTHAERRDTKWLEPLEGRISLAANATIRVDLDLQGLQCSACVWLIEQLFRRLPDALRIVVNPAIGAAEMLVRQGFPLRAFVAEIERFGYVAGPSAKANAPARDTLLIRIGVCSALAMNTMIFSLPIYFGLRSGAVYIAFRWIAFALSTTSVLVGGSVFIHAAWRGVRRGILHLDLPIATGIVLAYAGSVASFVRGRDGASYFDTLGIFIALMLTGRWLQERVLDRNRRALLASDELDTLLTRRLEGDRLHTVRCRDVRIGDCLMIAPGDLVPVDARLDGVDADFSLDWIQGEAEPRRFASGETVPSGAFNASARALRMTASTDFAASELASLLRAPAHDADEEHRAPANGLSLEAWPAIYVIGVLVVATAVFAFWAVHHGAARALEVTTAVLVVTCPCAFGIATPLAYELVQQGLRRAGLFVRRRGFLDRAARVRTVVFDKTGTLTTGAPQVTNTEDFASLSPDERDILYTLASSNNHPRSVAVRRALESFAPRFLADRLVTEFAGRGVELVSEATVFRFGAGRWAGSGGDGSLVFSAGDTAKLTILTDESPRPGAGAEVSQLVARGYTVWILSGDTQARIDAMADRLGIDRTRAVGACSPEDKRRWLGRHDHHDTLMVGDGVNDALAVQRAFCSGTPAIDRPLMPSRTDFYFTTAGLAPIGLALAASRRLCQVHRRNLRLALAYNSVSVSLACVGAITPLLCAVLMPLSSLALLATTTASLSKGASLWRS